MFAPLIVTLIVFVTLTQSTVQWETNWNNGLRNDKHKDAEGLLEALLSNGQDKCNGKRCVHSDQCCPGSVCVDTNGVALQVAISDMADLAGTCLPIYGLSEVDTCESDSDCDAGLKCQNMDAVFGQSPASGRLRSCRPGALTVRKKQYNDECVSSSECDSSRGLCCQVMRRHRTMPRKICYYFSDPKSCVGAMADGSRARTFFPHIVGPNSLFKARMG
ncbi:ITG-like peptide [Halotydeus destructor]|nr:ITG-like peptide [Halotydeus destructor]